MIVNDYPKILQMLYILGQQVTKTNASTMSADDIIAVKEIMPQWKEGQHTVKSVVQHNGQPWCCLQTHDSTGNPAWCPGKASSLWKPYHATSRIRALPWQTPTGAHDCYRKGEYMVWVDGKTYRSQCDGNIQSPETYSEGWLAE